MPKKRRSPKHPFHFRTGVGIEGVTERTITAWAKVRIPTRAVTVTLVADTVRKAIKAEGIGNTQTCAMAMCVRSHADMFPHHVEGYVDWQYRRAFVVSKLNKHGFPIECYVYKHGDNIARHNDTKGGQQRLLQEIVNNGPITVTLRPPNQRSHHALGKPVGKATGTRKRPSLGMGAKLRFAVAQLGGVPQ